MTKTRDAASSARGRMSDHYAVLGVDRRASAEEIKRAYRRLTLESHPDRHPDEPEAHERFRLINAAYAVVGDPTKRSRYDMQSRISGIDITQKFDPVSARDLLGNVFGDVFRSKRRARRRGRDLRYTLTVSFEQAVLGSVHEIAFDALGPCDRCTGSGTRPGGATPQTCSVCGGRGEVKGDGLFAPWTRCGRCDGTGLLQEDPCESCRGSGRKRSRREFEVKLPPGTDSGSQKVIEGRGEPGRFGAAAGDLRVTVNVVPHRYLSRDGAEVRTDAYVSITEAALGARIEVPTVNGAVTVDLPKGVKGGSKLRLRGKGVPSADGKTRGDQLVAVRIETPRATSPQVRDALEALERACSEAAALPERDEQRSPVAATEGDDP